MTKQDQRQVYELLEPNDQKQYAAWVKECNARADDFSVPNKIRGALIGWMDAAFKVYDRDAEDGDPRYYFIAAILGYGRGSANMLTGRQAEFLLEQLTTPVENGYVLSLDGVNTAKAITKAAIEALTLPLDKDEPEGNPKEPGTPPAEALEDQPTEEEVDVEEKRVAIDTSGLPHFKTVNVRYVRKFGTKLPNGDYHNVEADVGVWFDVPADERIGPQIDNTWEYLKEQVRAQIVPVVSALKPAHPKPAPAGAPASAPAQTAAPPAPAGRAPVAPSQAPAAPAASNGAGVKTGTADLKKITVDADGKVEFYVGGFRYPFKDARGAEVVAGLFDTSLGWTPEHFYPGVKYDGPEVVALKVDWAKPEKYYNVELVHA